MAFYSGTIQNSSGNDLYETPGASLDLVLDELNPETDFLWEPFPGTGRSTRHMESRGFGVTNGDNEDFFKQSLPKTPDGTSLVLVTNPPYSIKKEILLRLAELRVDRVALLVPAATLYTKYFFDYQNTVPAEVQMIVHTKRCNFIDPRTGTGVKPKGGKGRGSASFDIAWITHGLGLRRGINFPRPVRSDR